VGAAGYEYQDTTANFGGTSSACPLVAGVAALVLSANPGLTAAEVRQILQQTADKIIDRTPDPQFNWIKGTYENGGRSDWFGFGKVNAQRAVQAAIQRLQAMSAPAQRQIQLENADSQPIPDADGLGVTSAISVKDAGLVRTVQVDVMIDHPYMGDVELRLIAPTGQNVLLQGRTLGRQRRLKATYTVQTTPLLRWLLNQPAEGDWQLQAIDFAQGDVGRIVRWRLTLGV
ncbi:MAG TPA: proprotein convertase P-domain-containing protein, partial [Coleofasciculaceae cyanobacterium]